MNKLEKHIKKTIDSYESPLDLTNAWSEFESILDNNLEKKKPFWAFILGFIFAALFFSAVYYFVGLSSSDDTVVPTAQHEKVIDYADAQSKQKSTNNTSLAQPNEEQNTKTDVNENKASSILLNQTNTNTNTNIAISSTAKINRTTNNVFSKDELTTNQPNTSTSNYIANKDAMAIQDSKSLGSSEYISKDMIETNKLTDKINSPSIQMNSVDLSPAAPMLDFAALDNHKMALLSYAKTENYTPNFVSMERKIVPIKSTSRHSVAFQGGPLLHRLDIKSTSLRPSVLDGLVDPTNTFSEFERSDDLVINNRNELTGYDATIAYTYALTKNFNLRSGISYKVFVDKTVDAYDLAIGEDTSISRIIIDETSIPMNIYSARASSIQHRQRTDYNYLKTFQIPLELGYALNSGKWSLAVNFGLGLNYIYSYSELSLPDNNNLADTSSEFKTKQFILSTQGQLTVNRQIADNWDLFASVHAGKYLQDISNLTNNAASLSYAGLNAGLSYRF